MDIIFFPYMKYIIYTQEAQQVRVVKRTITYIYIIHQTSKKRKLTYI